jgi:exosome complex component RRP45
MDEKSPIPLSIHHIPIAVTFAFFHSGSIHVVDPTSLEESVQESSLTIITNIHREICCLSKAGGVPIDHDKFMECVHIANQKTVQITEAIKAAIAESLVDPSASSLHNKSNKKESA